MTRILTTFWVFLLVATISGGLLGRYVGAVVKGYANLEIALFILPLAALFGFSLLVLVRILKASTEAKRQWELAKAEAEAKPQIGVVRAER